MQPNDVGIIAKVVAEAVQKVTAPLLAEITALKARPPERGEKGDKGDLGERGETGPTGTAGKDGRDGIDGKDGAPGLNGIDGIPGAKGLDGVNGKDGRDGIDGKDAQPITAALVLEALSASPALLQKAVELYLAANPVPAGKDGADGLHGKDGSVGPQGPEGLAGRDGLPGVPGRPGDPGLDGKDGLDGLGFDDIDVAYDGDRDFTLTFIRGDRRKTFGSFTLPIVIDRGVFKKGHRYERGDAVTWGGSAFIAQAETSTEPETSKDWRLAVKRGQNGKNGDRGPQGPQGVKGDAGQVWHP